MGFFLQQTVNGLALGSVFALFALGFSLVFATMKAFHVAHAAVFTWGAVFAWKLTDGFGWPLVTALPVVAILAGCLNVVTYLIAVRHLERRKNRDMAIFISSLGAGTVLTELATHVLHNVSVRLPFDLVTSRAFDLGVVNVSSLQLIMVGTAALMFFGIRWLIGSTQFGREMQSVAFDREVAGILGVNAPRVSALVFFLSGALAGVGATLVAVSFNVIDGSLGHNYLVLAIAILVVGGLGNVAGGFIGGLLIGLASAYATGYITSSYRDVVVFGVLMLFLICRPDGLFRSDNVLGRA
jgi:branched-chain amino acid transport system permease protein